MPVRVVGTLSREQEARIADEIIRTSEHVANKFPAFAYVIIEATGEKCAAAGELLDTKG